MPLSKQQLLIPRVLCIGGKEGEPNYPNSPVNTGDILELTIHGYVFIACYGVIVTRDTVSKFPHLFKPLPWWYGRTVEEMPLYVKSHDGVYFKIKWVNSVNWMFYNDTDFIEGKYCEPATLEDYQEYQKKGGVMADIKNATKQELLKEYEKCEKLWGKYSSDCFGFYLTKLHSKIIELGGWEPLKQKEAK